jgi:tellurite resistance protein TerC
LTSDNILFWLGFNAVILVLLMVDLLVVGRREGGLSIKGALLMSAFWITLSLGFNAGVYYYRGTEAALQFLTGYLIEYSLSVDNLFVFLLVFSYFRVPHKYQHKVLFLGIVGALVMRAVMILVGAALIQRFHWIIYVFGAFLVYSGIKMARQDEADIEPEANPVVRLVSRLIPVRSEFHGDKFFVKLDGKRYATLLFIVLIVVETTDLVFALDSIPAIFAVTTDPFIVYTSNVFAILGLRSLYFALAGLMNYFHYLKVGLSLILVFVGVKMLLSEVYKIPIVAALGVIVVVLAASVVASLIWPKPEEVSHIPHADPPAEADNP